MSFLKKLLFLPISIFVLVLACGTDQQAPHSFEKPNKNPQKSQNEQDTSVISLLFVGDIMQHEEQITSAYNAKTKKYNYDACFEYVKPIFDTTDLVIGNLELTFAGKPYTGYPMFSAPDELAFSLAKAGFDFLVTANNHSCDKGKIGVTRTLQILDSAKIPHTGTFKDTASALQQHPYLLEKNGFKIALLNYTYGTNGVSIKKPTIVNLIDSTLIINDLEKAKKANPDFIITFMHWGLEYQHQPSKEQKMIADLCLANGANAVIGSHPHVLQPMQRFHYPDSSGKEAIVVYSLGNFISNQRTSPRDGGAMFRLTLEKINGKIQLKESKYYLTWVDTHNKKGKALFRVFPLAFHEKDSVIFNKTALNKMHIFGKSARKLLQADNLKIDEIKPFAPANDTIKKE